MNIASSIFRENDIRGTYPEQINESNNKINCIMPLQENVKNMESTL